MKLATRQKKLWKQLTDNYRVPRVVNGTLMHHKDNGKPVMRRVKSVKEFFTYYKPYLDACREQIIKKNTAK